MKTLEKRAWVILFAAILMVGVAWALEIGPFIVSDTSGSPLHILNTAGYIQNSGAKQMTSTSNWVIQNSAAAAKSGFHYNGALLAHTDNVSATAIAAATAEVTATFAVAEPDTNYKIIGNMEDVTTGVTGTLVVKRRNVGTFVIGATNINSSTCYYTWTKVRQQ